MLSESFKETVDKLQIHMEYINRLAYKDSLTGTKNKTAYVEKVNIEILTTVIKEKYPQYLDI